MTRISGRRRAVVAGLAVIVVIIAVPGVVAALAPADAAPPPGAEAFADQVRSSFATSMRTGLPPYRVAIREWRQKGPSSFLAVVDVYDLIYGPSPRRGYAVVGCWAPGVPFSGGWADDAAGVGEMDADLASTPSTCP